MQGTSGEVLCGKAVELHPVADARCLVPIQFYDAIGRIAPAFEMFAHTEGTNHAANAFANRLHGAIVQMVVVVVGDDQHICPRQFLDCVAVAAFEGG